MKNLFFILAFVFSLSAFASGFETSDLEQKEKVELCQDLDFDQTESLIVKTFKDSKPIDNINQHFAINSKAFKVNIEKQNYLPLKIDNNYRHSINLMLTSNLTELIFKPNPYKLLGYVGWEL